MNKTATQLNQIRENVKLTVKALRDIADGLEKGDARLLTVTANIEPEYPTVEHLPIGSGKRRIPLHYVRTLTVTYSESASPFVTCKLEDFTR
jgi:hypothetical protein